MWLTGSNQWRRITTTWTGTVSGTQWEWTRPCRHNQPLPWSERHQNTHMMVGQGRIEDLLCIWICLSFVCCCLLKTINRVCCCSGGGNTALNHIYKACTQLRFLYVFKESDWQAELSSVQKEDSDIQKIFVHCIALYVSYKKNDFLHEEIYLISRTCNP